MKNFLFATVFSLLSIFSSAQSSTYHCSFVKRGEWSSYSQKYIWNEGKDTDMKIVFLDNYIRVYDNAESYYVLTSDEKKNKNENFEMSSWDGKDEKGRKVSVSIIHYFSGGQIVLMVLYQDIAFAYTIDNNRLSPLNN